MNRYLGPGLWLTVLALAAAPAAGAPAAAEQVRGRVATGDGVAIEHARVTEVRSDRQVFTDGGGRFALDCPLPCLLLVTHPRFVEHAVDLAGSPDGEVTVVLVPKREVYEEIVVTADRGGDAFAPVAIASTVVKAEEKAAPPSSLTELVEGVPGVAENGQGGLFQVFSIRGVSRQRVTTLVAGMRIAGERRAGVSTSFVDPLLIGSADVLRGPASTHYGSGALGGVVQVFPRRFDGWRVVAGYDAFGDERYQSVGWGDGEWSLGVAHRQRDDDAAADGTALNDHFTQLSATLSRTWSRDGRTYEALALPSLGRDIGKSNTDFPERVTEYPRESHLLLRFGVAADSGWSASVYAHPNALETEALLLGESLATVDNEAFDLGADFERRFTLGAGVSGSFGFDYFGRRGVVADERQHDFATGTVVRERTLDGEEDEAATFGSLAWTWGSTRVQAGARATWNRQRNAGFAAREDTAWTGFVGLVQPLGRGLELAATVGTGLRFASLSERFFTGTTGRGQVLGNPGLEPESAWNADLGLRWYGDQVFVSGQVFRLGIDDYIERVDLDDDLQTFVNLTSGWIAGFELEGFYQPAERWLVTWNGHLIDGEEDGTGRPLADVPPHRVQLGLEHRRERWQSRLVVQHRFARSEPGSGEKAIPEATLVALSLAYELRDGLELVASGRNLLDEVYFNSADRKSPVAAGRSLGLHFVWQP